MKVSMSNFHQINKKKLIVILSLKCLHKRVNNKRDTLFYKQLKTLLLNRAVSVHMNFLRQSQIKITQSQGCIKLLPILDLDKHLTTFNNNSSQVKYRQ